MRSIEVKQAHCVLNMGRVILVASLLAVIELAGSSMLDRLEQHRVNTKKVCVEDESALEHEIFEAGKEILLKCQVPKDGHDLGKYLDRDPITGQVTCKQNAIEKCKASVQDWGKVWQKVWNSVPDPTICYMYEYVITFVNSCK